jgi:hypothetical protein
MKHTALPWKLGWASVDGLPQIDSVEDECPLADVWAPSGVKSEALANAKFIVTSCNSHDRMVETLEKTLAALKELSPACHAGTLGTMIRETLEFAKGGEQ